MIVKAILHAHSTNSDGVLRPEELVDYLYKKGYRVIAITDHNYITKVKNPYPGDVVLLEGYEDTFRWHITHIEDKWYKAGSGITILCHPKRWNLEGYEIKDLIKRYNLDGVELFNRGQKQYESSLLKSSIEIAVDDFHHPKMELRSWIELEVKELSKEEVLRQIKEKKFWIKTNVTKY